ncbi:melatonin receptor type 1A-like [Oculina patagonica]
MSAGKEGLALNIAQRGDVLIIIEATALILVDITALIGNTLVFAVAYRNRRRLTITDLLIVALSLTDLLVALTVMPLSTGALITGTWLYNRSVCLFQGFCVITFATASLNTLSVIAVNRFFCVVKPNDYRTVFSMKKTLGYLAIVWLLACSFSTTPLIFGREDYAFQPGKVLCVYPFEINIAYTVCLDILFIGLPTTAICICYWRVFRTVRGRNRVMTGNGDDLASRVNVQDANITKTLVVVLVGFAFCWLPVLVMDTIDVVTGALILPRQLYLFYTFMVFASSTINPFIYALVNKRFRREYGKILRRLCCRRRQLHGGSMHRSSVN